MEKGEKLMKKAQELFKQISHALEVLMAVFVLAGIVLGIVNLLFHTSVLRELFTGNISMMEYLEKIFAIVIGIEFLQMLCKPDASNVLEVLIFLVARHMIIGETTPYEDFISVISICLLVIVRRVLHQWKVKADNRKSENQ